MSKVEHTASERRAIAAAWDAAARVVECDHRAERDLWDGLKIDRRERGSMWAAKALLAECFYNPPAETSGFFALARGCQMAAILGAHYAARPGYYHEAKATTAAACEAAHNAAVHRALAAIRIG